MTETAAHGLEQVLEGTGVQKTGEGDGEQPPAKRLKLDSAGGGEETQKGVCVCVCVCVCVKICDRA